MEGKPADDRPGKIRIFHRERFVETIISLLRRMPREASGRAAIPTRFGPLGDAAGGDLIVAGRLASPGSLAAIDAAGQAIDQPGTLLVRALDADVTGADRTQQGREQDRS